MQMRRACCACSNGMRVGVVRGRVDVQVHPLPLSHRDSNRVNEEWFNDMESIQERAGLPSGTSPSTHGPEVQCLICFDSFAKDDMCAAACGHYFCKDCWRGYICAKIDEGPAALNMRCPLPECKISV